MTSPHEPKRYHGLDFLRGLMMMLGLVIHTVQYYITLPFFNSKYIDPSTSISMDLIMIFINTFRMPTFFVLSGFFTALLFYKLGRQGLASNRMRRLLGPFLLFWPLAAALLVLLQRYWDTYRFHGYWGLHPDQVETLYQGFHSTWHFWFLYYLILYIGAALILMPLIQKISSRIKEKFLNKLKTFFPTIHGMIFFSLITMIFAYSNPSGRVSIDTNLVTSPLSLIYFSYYFVLGWWLFLCRDILASLSKPTWRNMGLATVFLIVGLVVFTQLGTVGSEGYTIKHALLVAANSLSILFYIFGFIGMALRYFSTFSPVSRYLTDMSFWAYIIHLPVITLIAQVLFGWEMIAEVKALVVLSLSTGICFISYDLFVRNGRIGRILNGRAYPSLLKSRNSNPPD
ncbi:acyltransferase family protein [Temperatibacter marinus]|uniref:Acyltransferase family protein n=1 Tax=Temperatibacter marinus TaxID=1456591 RepID=A0AA52EG00_9PROT|nr:acyltransferase family protein [Temperatibacter marinus]WND04035.1 acyltransferase family protein [Temperatibacter marinus]